MKKQSLKQFIFEKLGKGEYILDQDVSTFMKKDFSYYTVECYKREYRNFQHAKEYFKEYEDDLPNTELVKSRRTYMLRKKGNEAYWKIPKAYYQYLEQKKIVHNSAS